MYQTKGLFPLAAVREKDRDKERERERLMSGRPYTDEKCEKSTSADDPVGVSYHVSD